MSTKDVDGLIQRIEEIFDKYNPSITDIQTALNMVLDRLQEIQAREVEIAASSV